MSNKVILTFTGQWVDCISFEDLLLNANPDFSKFLEIVFVLPKNCKFFLETIARFLALCNQLVSINKVVTIDLSKNSNSMSFFNRAGFFDQLDKKVNILPNWPETSTAKFYKGNSQKLVEFGAVDRKDENKELINQLTDSFVATANNDKEYENPVFTILAEMIKNIQYHSESNLKGFAALQKYDGFSKRKPHIQIIVSDSGIGIAATLKPHLKTYYPQLQELSDLELVKMVLQGNQLSKHGSNPESGHGMGFKSSHEKASMFNAKYSIRQIDFSLEFEFKKGKLLPPKEHTGLVKILGTHICFDFVIDDS